MQMQAKLPLTGLKRSKGNGDGVSLGKDVAWDYTEFYFTVDLNSKKGNSRGQAGQAFRFGTSVEYDRWEKITLPVMCEVDMQMVTNGKGDTTTEVLAIRPLPTEVKGSKAA